MSKITELKKYYGSKREDIRGRMKEFEAVFKGEDERVFEELCFCILTANTSARMGIDCIRIIREILLKGSAKQISAKLKGNYRFWRKRAEYIVHTREYLKKNCKLKIKDKILSYKDKDELRDFFAKNKDIKGLGYKEASHFLRNIGFKGYGILDKHILKCLFEFGIIDEIIPLNNKQKYTCVEEKMKRFAEKINIDFDELDLLLWSSKTGEILK